MYEPVTLTDTGELLLAPERAIDPIRYRRARELFERAATTPLPARSRLLDETVADDPALRSMIDALLAADSGGASAVERALVNVRDGVASDLVSGIPERVGPYAIVRRIGGGGMGVVFATRRDGSETVVALKVAGPFRTTPAFARRLEHEAAALARLDHLGIARVLDSGVATTPWGEQPWIAMELVDGEPFTAAACSIVISSPTTCWSRATV
ncbi:MAG: hypothetical protein EXS13_11820 [Planctomycetes bacterium]|nr:hypothetical protein [Planctomycetota bacterium]